MKLAIISDTHDNIDNIRKAVDIIKKEKVDQTIHLGDFVAPFTFENYKGLNIMGIFGNNDGDRFRMMNRAQIYKIDVKGDVHTFEQDGLTFVAYHGTEPVIIDALIHCQKYDVVLYGHTHRLDQRTIGKTIVINPGTVHGFGKDATFIILDTKTKKQKIVKIK